jgi:hypothetical protein
VGVFHFGWQLLPEEEENWCLAAAQPLPNTKPLSSPYAEGQIADFREMHPFSVAHFTLG